MRCPPPLSRCERCQRRTHTATWCPGGSCSPRLIQNWSTVAEVFLASAVFVGLLWSAASVGGY